MRKRTQSLLIPLMMVAALGTAHAQLQTRGDRSSAESGQPEPVTVEQARRSPIIVDGKGWLNASAEERRAFLIGMANMIVAEAAYAKHRKLPEPAAGAHITETLKQMNLAQTSERISAWYGAHPDKQDKPVMGVIWRVLADDAPK